MKIEKVNMYVRFLGLLVLSVTIIAVGVRCSSNKTSTNSGGGSGQSITMSGVLQQGPVNVVVSSYGAGISKAGKALVSSSQLSGLSVTPLTGDVLYCVAFSNTPTAAKSQPADASGNVSLSIAAQGIPFGCFVQDTSANIVGALIFLGSTGFSRSVQLSGSANLGTIMVDLNSGLAEADLPANGTLVTTTPSDAGCPVGTWKGSIWGSPCAAGDMTATVLVAKSLSGNFIISMTAGPGCGQGNGCTMCGDQSFMNITGATYQNGVLTLSVPVSSQSCGGVLTLTPDSTCHTAAISLSSTGCSSCTSHTECCSPSTNICGSPVSGCGEQTNPNVKCTDNTCGSVTCSNGPYTMTKQ